MEVNKFHILIVDDEWNMRNLLRIHLTKAGFQVSEAKNGQEALELLEQQNVDLIILDLMMPDMDGLDVCAKIRQTKQTPILMLTARTDTRDKVEGLNVGADDYLTKPFEAEELVARVHALLRRAYRGEAQLNKGILTFRKLKIDPAGRKVIVAGQPVHFTPKEFSLLLLLASHPERVFTREHLLYHIWGEDYIGDERTVDTHIKSIRAKFRQAGLSYNPIQTVWGVGYKFKEWE
ncbi:response regulator transcription factor [Caldalkalibacillus thermarum TA2.A1]|uniref:histidine kinase n=1 Tax=Caldalkalibacillus thermarum (strain TA2.A1) TaxID=986075 RepID=A0A8X8I7C3_CALTT|nr:response regulator transcription factor [Caldalkalibacillus thermarum TA2.A1]